MKRLQKGLVLLSAVLLSAGAFAIAEFPAATPQVRAYSGQDGVKVWVERIGPRLANMALVRIGGVEHHWNMRIQKMDVQYRRGGARYQLRVGDAPYVALDLDGDCGEVRIPGEAKGRSVCFDPGLSGEQDAKGFLTSYLNQPR